jgi:hypothetical protein
MAAIHVLRSDGIVRVAHQVGVGRVVFNNQDVLSFAHHVALLGGSLTMVNQKSSMAFTTRMN